MAPSKQCIILAAIDCFSEKGYDLTAMQDVADRAGIHTSDLLNDYGDKDTLLEGVMEYYKHAYQKQQIPVDAVLDAADEKPISEVLPMLFFKFHADAEYPALLKAARIMAELNRNREAVHKWVLTIRIDEPMDYLRSVFSRLISSGRVRRFDYESLAFQMVSFSNMIFEMLLEGGDQKRVDQIYHSGIAFFVQSMENMLLMDAMNYAG